MVVVEVVVVAVVLLVVMVVVVVWYIAMAVYIVVYMERERTRGGGGGGTAAIFADRSLFSRSVAHARDTRSRTQQSRIDAWIGKKAEKLTTTTIAVSTLCSTSPIPFQFYFTRG